MSVFEIVSVKRVKLSYVRCVTITQSFDFLNCSYVGKYEDYPLFEVIQSWEIFTVFNTHCAWKIEDGTITFIIETN